MHTDNYLYVFIIYFIIYFIGITLFPILYVVGLYSQN